MRGSVPSRSREEAVNVTTIVTRWMEQITDIHVCFTRLHSSTRQREAEEEKKSFSMFLSPLPCVFHGRKIGQSFSGISRTHGNPELRFLIDIVMISSEYLLYIYHFFHHRDHTQLICSIFSMWCYEWLHACMTWLSSEHHRWVNGHPQGPHFYDSSQQCYFSLPGSFMITRETIMARFISFSLLFFLYCSYTLYLLTHSLFPPSYS